MRKIKKTVILSDQYTTEIGKKFAKAVQKIMEKRQIEVHIVSVNTEDNIADAVYQFDRINLELKPDLLMVLDLACVKMQSPEEEPLYNNMTIPVVHILFRRPWEYDVFMGWRTNFIDRFYTLIPQDVDHIKKYYGKWILNVKTLRPDLFVQNIRNVWGAEWQEEKLSQEFEALPGYIKTLANQWEHIMVKNQNLNDEAAFRMCLDKIGFECSDAEYLDVLCCVKSMFSLYNKKQNRQVENIEIRMYEMEKQVDEFLMMDFPVSLL